ncbi:MAG: hypothetical protein ACM3ML_14590 [Micromonosporaceae bacterium]
MSARGVAAARTFGASRHPYVVEFSAVAFHAVAFAVVRSGTFRRPHAPGPGTGHFAVTGRMGCGVCPLIRIRYWYVC